MSVFNACPCCVSTGLLIYGGGVAIVLLGFGKVLELTFPNAKLGIKVYKYISAILSVVIALVAIAYGVLSTNESVRSFAFAKMMEAGATGSNPMDALRCATIQNLSGRVLEIGPGPGTNFRCWQNNTAITEWVGVEPNAYFQKRQLAESVTRNISFPVSTVWLKGEHLDVKPESFDYVVGTHVLCSVDDVDSVLKQVSRALKPHGEYHFMEHVAAEEGSSLRGWQQFFAPAFHVIGNGCKFKALWNNLSPNTGLKGFDVELNFVDAADSVPFPLIAPHVTGIAIKL